MARYRGPRLKKCRQVGVVLPGLTNKSVLKRPFPPGQHGTRRKGKQSDFKERMVEKQKTLKAEVRDLLAQAEAADAEEDARHGQHQSGDELPAELKRRLVTVAEAAFLSSLFSVEAFAHLECHKQVAPECFAKTGETISVYRRHNGAQNFYAVNMLIEDFYLDRDPPRMFRGDPGSAACWRCFEYKDQPRRKNA